MSDGFHSVAGGGLSWYAPSRPAVASVALQPGTPALLGGPLMTAFARAVAPPTPPATHTGWLREPPPRVISVAIGRPTLRVRSFTFSEPLALPAALESRPSAAISAGCRPTATQPAGLTRIKPPGDVIKLEDRLSYLLQPPLQWLLAERSLGFPCRPFPFQFEGVAFLYPRQAAILADEMGLGKTMQAITAIRLLLRCGELRTVLLVCPKPLVNNWRHEFGLWAPELPVMVIEGDQARRGWQWQLPDVPVRIANYELLCRDRELLERHPLLGGGPAGSGRPVHFDLVVLDESQRIKNLSSATSQVARAISRRRSWALTGTPVENRAEDLVGIFEFLAPGFLSPDMKPRRMGRTISDYVLRRTKEQVLADLPPKLFRDAEMELTAPQRESYRLAEEEGVVRLTELGRSATIQHVFELILRLKQICNFDPATLSSAKLERLEADLEEIAGSGRKALVFSQWVGTLKLLAGRLERFGLEEYHGQVPAARREAVLRRFRENAGCHVLLISYGAGGVGLNLQQSNYVFLFDRWWNPAVEDQAINRAHRIGIQSPVTVTRFLMLETIEERIDRILQEKRELFETIFSGAEGRRHMGLTQEELFGLFQLKCPGGPIDLAA
jgi:SNF2 family DNA or RNA helicase